MVFEQKYRKTLTAIKWLNFRLFVFKSHESSRLIALGYEVIFTKSGNSLRVKKFLTSCFTETFWNEIKLIFLSLGIFSILILDPRASSFKGVMQEIKVLLNWPNLTVNSKLDENCPKMGFDDAVAWEKTGWGKKKMKKIFNQFSWSAYVLISGTLQWTVWECGRDVRLHSQLQRVLWWEWHQ